MKKWCALYGLMIVALFVGIYWWWAHADDDRRIVEVQKLQAQLFSEESEQLTEEQRDELRGQLRAQMEQLTEDQRAVVRRASREQFREQLRERIQAFNQMSSEERIAFLDEQIDQMEQRRRQMGSRSGNPSSRRPPSDRGGSPGRGRPEFGRGRGGRASRTEEDRERWRRQRLDNSTPRERAEFAAFVEALRERREARGLSR